MAVTHVEDHQAQAASRILTQFQRPNMQAVVAGFSQHVQQLEDCLFSLFNAFDLSTATGAQLDVVARLLGISRYGLTDDQLRVLLRAAINVENGTATAADLVATVASLFQTGAVFFADGGAGKHTAQVARSTVFLAAGDSNLPQEALTLARSLIAQALGGGIALGYLARMDSKAAFACQGPQPWVAGYASVASPSAGGKMAGLSD